MVVRVAPSDLPPIAGLDGKILEWILCYGCNRYGHVKKKDGIVNCPTWKEPNAPPKAVVEQVVGQEGGAVDIDALRARLSLASSRRAPESTAFPDTPEEHRTRPRLQLDRTVALPSSIGDHSGIY